MYYNIVQIIKISWCPCSMQDLHVGLGHRQIKTVKLNMAEGRAVVSIDKNLIECSICCGPFDDPRALPCLHPFCCSCLESWAKTCSKDGKIVNCPLCKKIYRVPEEEGIRGFPVHFIVANLQVCVNLLIYSWEINVTISYCKIIMEYLTVFITSFKI